MYKPWYISNLFLHTFSIVIAFEEQVWSANREYAHLSAIRSLMKITWLSSLLAQSIFMVPICCSSRLRYMLSSCIFSFNWFIAVQQKMSSNNNHLRKHTHDSDMLILHVKHCQYWFYPTAVQAEVLLHHELYTKVPFAGNHPFLFKYLDKELINIMVFLTSSRKKSLKNLNWF